MLYLKLHIWLAARAVRECTPLYKIRPKFHVLACEILLPIKHGSRFNPRFTSCMGDEDLIGQFMLTVRGVSARSMTLRSLQRYVLELNRTS